eukprot:CAMPEP_0202695004 /NCGR_PEP_ID=MMETSP1385-20130828/8713_1 /ASSEMBLY_ACC=CAM_ASM_000861 /TAXON_ID=933848 /ORGANISM="Elphidium margaritaceum" /LENGTH=251 /DNA_ID=CAMNT_0049350957 /DNA_START=55 /DNA_END=810 /DNA_ORIENTATION=-
MEPEVEITQADESQYLAESISERKSDIAHQDEAIPDKSMFLNWNKDILRLAKTPTFQDDLWSIARGFRNGCVYGIKIRFPHALVMTLIFTNDRSIQNMSRTIFKKTKEHSLHLGHFVMMYKLLVVVVRRILRYPHNHFPIIHLLAGGIGGGIVWGKRTAINHQINLYVFSRIFMGLVRSGVERGYFDGTAWKKWYLFFASLTWAIVMYLFEFEEHNLSRSLAASMRYLYHNEMKKPGDVKQIWQWLSTSSV